MRFPPEADAEQAAANLRDLSGAAGGFLSTRDQTEDLENTLDSLGQSIADLQRVELDRPWTWRVLGGTHRLSAHLTSAQGEHLIAELGEVTVGGLRGAPWLLALLGAVLTGVLMVARPFASGRRGRSTAPSVPRIEMIVGATHDSIRRGASPSRVVEELARRYPGAEQNLIDLDQSVLTNPRFPYLRTRPGRKRLLEIQEILRQKSHSRPALADALVRILSQAAGGQLSPEAAAKNLSAHTTSEERDAFVALSFDKLAETLRSVASSYPALGGPRGRGIAVAIQDALRAGEDQKFGVSVGWLVRAGGPGRRGETLRLEGTTTVVGSSPGSGLRITVDPVLAPEHAEVFFEDGEYSIAPLGGSVKVEGEEVKARQVLVDGETIDLGSGIYVFKSASVRSLTERRQTGRHSNPN